MYDNQESISMMAVLMISILISNVYSYEEKKNMKEINRYCAGRRKLYINKLLALAVTIMNVSVMTSYAMSFGVAMVPVLLHMPKFLGMKWGLWYRWYQYRQSLKILMSMEIYL